MTYKLIKKGDTKPHRCKKPKFFLSRRFGVGAVIECSCDVKYKLKNSDGFFYWSAMEKSR